ncbi:hypothetical protein V8E54_013827 [Elaphomyces granulatus]
MSSQPPRGQIQKAEVLGGIKWRSQESWLLSPCEAERYASPASLPQMPPEQWRQRWPAPYYQVVLEMRRIRSETRRPWVLVDGLEMVAEQDFAQVELMTGRKPPKDSCGSIFIAVMQSAADIAEYPRDGDHLHPRALTTVLSALQAVPTSIILIPVEGFKQHQGNPSEWTVVLGLLRRQFTLNGDPKPHGRSSFSGICTHGTDF